MSLDFQEGVWSQDQTERLINFYLIRKEIFVLMWVYGGKCKCRSGVCR